MSTSPSTLPLLPFNSLTFPPKKNPPPTKTSFIQLKLSFPNSAKYSDPTFGNCIKKPCSKLGTKTVTSLLSSSLWKSTNSAKKTNSLKTQVDSLKDQAIMMSWKRFQTFSQSTKLSILVFFTSKNTARWIKTSPPSSTLPLWVMTRSSSRWWWMVWKGKRGGPLVKIQNRDSTLKASPRSETLMQYRNRRTSRKKYVS